MDILNSIEQESGLFVFERWRQRPEIALNDERFKGPEKVIEIKDVNEGLKSLYEVLNADTRNEAIIFDLGSHVKEDQLYSILEAKAINRIHQYKIFDWDEYQICVALIPEMLFEKPEVNLILIIGLADSHFVSSRRDIDKTHFTNERHVRQQIARLNHSLEPYDNLYCLIDYDKYEAFKPRRS